MRPTFSIILFTVLSGAGYGLLFLLGLDLALGADRDARAATAALVAGFALSSLGLIASVAHLGQPSRAWRAFSQWRSSWLSREGIAALATCLPIAAIAALLVARPGAGVALRACGALLSACCVATVCCTARIYSSLPPVRAWHNRHTLPAYLLLALYSGAAWYNALQAAAPSTAPGWRARSAGAIVIVAALACALLKRGYWRYLDALVSVTAGRATGLEALGTVRSFEQPHTEENYLTREMGFVLARRHARRLRSIAITAGMFAPALLVALGLAWPAVRGAAAWLALAGAMAGLFIERWLFFAEARHAVIAYYAR